MIVVRDLLLGKHRYSEFLAGPERITTNILADRLRRLEEEGLIQREAYQEHPVRFDYTLTQKGRDLGPLMQEMIAWAQKYEAEVIRRAGEDG